MHSGVVVRELAGVTGVYHLTKGDRLANGGQCTTRFDRPTFANGRTFILSKRRPVVAVYYSQLNNCPRTLLCTVLSRRGSR